MVKQSDSGIGKSAQRLLARLAAAGGSLEQCTLAALRPPAASDADILIANDLAVRGPDGALDITPVGRSHLARIEIARSGAEIDPFLAQHLDLARTELATATGRARVDMDTAESPLVWLARRKGRDGRALIEPVQLQAGERLRADFTRPAYAAHHGELELGGGAGSPRRRRDDLHGSGGSGAPARAPRLRGCRS
jgi:Domain of unknown function (DUF6456)